MSLVRWDPFSELNSLHEQVNSLFNDSFSAAGMQSFQAAATDVYSDESGLTIEAHLPNFKDSEITVQQHEGDLEIKAEHQEKQEKDDSKKHRQYIMRESTNRYYRRFTLPKNSDADNIQAKFEDGVLKLTVPYKELPQPKQIAISAKTKK